MLRFIVSRGKLEYLDTNGVGGSAAVKLRSSEALAQIGPGWIRVLLAWLKHCLAVQRLQQEPYFPKHVNHDVHGALG